MFHQIPGIISNAWFVHLKESFKELFLPSCHFKWTVLSIFAFLKKERKYAGLRVRKSAG